MIPLPPRSTLFPYTSSSDLWIGLAARYGVIDGIEPRLDALDIEAERSEEHTSNSSHLGISYAVFCLKKKKKGVRPLHAKRQPESGWELLDYRDVPIHACRED